jgi:cullin 1
MKMFTEQVFFMDELQKKITDAILEQIKAGREGKSFEKELVKKAIAVYVDIGLIKPRPMRTPDGLFLWQGDRSLSEYETHFETAFLDSTLKQSMQSAKMWNSTRNCPEYLREVQQFLMNEESNADYYLQPETKIKLLKIVEDEMITKMADSVSSKDTGCVHMFEQKNLDELKLLFEVFRRDTSTFGLIIQKMDPYIMTRGEKLVMDEANVKDPILFTEKLLEFKAEIDELVSYSFSN